MDNSDKNLGIILNRAARSMKRLLDSQLNPIGLTSSQYAVLTILWEEDGISLSELGKRLYFDNPTLTGIVDRLERDELLVRKRDETDRRMIKIFLTPKARSLEAGVTEHARKVNEKAFNTLNGTERRAIWTILDKIWKSMNESRTDLEEEG